MHHQDVVRLVLLQEAVDQLGLGRALLPHQEGTAADTDDAVDEELRPVLSRVEKLQIRASSTNIFIWQ